MDHEVSRQLADATGHPVLVPSAMLSDRLHHASQDWHRSEATTVQPQRIKYPIIYVNEEMDPNHIHNHIVVFTLPHVKQDNPYGEIKYKNTL